MIRAGLTRPRLVAVFDRFHDKFQRRQILDHTLDRSSASALNVLCGFALANWDPLQAHDISHFVIIREEPAPFRKTKGT